MADVAEKRVGSRTYRVYGLQGRAEIIRGATRRLSESTSTALEAVRTAVAEWRGPHAVAFVDRVNRVLSDMVSLQLAGELAASRCSSFPGEPYVSSMVTDYAYRGARVHDTPSADGTVSAVPADLHGYAGAMADQGGRFTGVAAEVTTDGLSADVSVLRPLTATERSEWEEEGVPRFEIDTASVWGDPQPVGVTEVFGLPDLSGQAAALSSATGELSVWVSAVAYAFEHADDGLLRLLLEHPELAGYLDQAALSDGRMTGEAALMIVLANLDLFDTAAGRGGDDDTVGVPDLEAVANDPNAPAHLRAAAQYLLDNRLLLSLASIADDSRSYEVEPEEGSLTPEGIALFLDYNEALRAVALDFDRLDIAADEDRVPDGNVSVDDLREVAGNPAYPPELREAASFLLANGALTQRLAFYNRANLDRMTLSTGGDFELTDAPVDFTYESVVALAVDQQAFASDPEAAHRFVLGLPMADRDGNGGLPITLTSDEGVIALANAALLDTRHDLSDQHAVISHLPETTGWGVQVGAVTQNGGVRNTLINGFYDLLAHRADELFAGPALAGHPDVPGHPGANWLM
ncbi:MAG: hypothetical protein ACRD0A_01560, partial [Acidimicrobiales bacterium]